MGYDSKNYPISMDAYHRVITLPVFYDLKKEDVKRVVDVIAKVVDHQLSIKNQ